MFNKSIFALALALAIGSSTLTVAARECFCKNADSLVIDALASNECCVQDNGQILNEGCNLPQNEREDIFAQCCLTMGDIGSCSASN